MAEAALLVFGPSMRSVILRSASPPPSALLTRRPSGNSNLATAAATAVGRGPVRESWLAPAPPAPSGSQRGQATW
eukprot:5029590-Alexandrium_andersonii.AAC.1